MFLERFNNYLRYEKRFSAHTVTAYMKDLQQFEAFMLKQGQEFSKVSHHDVRSWLVELMDAKSQPKTITRKLSTLRSFYKFLQREQMVEDNPVLQVQSPKIPKKLPVVIEESKMNTLLDSEHLFPQDFTGLRDRLILEILFGTGVRLSELIAIKHSDINHYEQYFRILGKRNKERLVPVNATLMKLVSRYIKEKKEAPFEVSSAPLIVTDTGRAATPAFIYKIVKKYLSHISTNQKRSPHVLRHSFATSLLNNGADLNAIKELLGHASLAATQVYTHNSVEKLKLIYRQAHPRALTKEEK